MTCLGQVDHMFEELFMSSPFSDDECVFVVVVVVNHLSIKRSLHSKL